ncbi:MAG TPA: hypothetical protein VJK07_01285 [Candidatus Nanoarchaeia archaeon]|nr:hypothetical protein [Candidatus Nanoarchaeia archaeon]
MENTKTAWIIGGIVLLVLLFVMPWGGRWGGFCGMMGSYGSGSYGSNYGWGMMSGGAFGFGWLFMILVTAALVLLIVWLMNQIQASGRRKR